MISFKGTTVFKVPATFNIPAHETIPFEGVFTIEETVPLATPEFLKDGWIVWNMDIRRLMKVTECDINNPHRWRMLRSVNLNELSVVRRGVRLWAYEARNHNGFYVTDDINMGGFYFDNRGRHAKSIIHALWVPSPVIPRAQWDSLV